MQVHSKTLRSLHTRAHVYPNVAVIKLSILLLAYNIEGLETSHGCPSHCFLLERKVCVTVQSVCIHTMVHTWTDGWRCISSCIVLYFQRVTRYFSLPIIKRTRIIEDDYIILGYCIGLTSFELVNVYTAQCNCNFKDICIFLYSDAINSDCIP